MVEFYARMVKKGNWKIEDVPMKWRTQVEERLATM